MFEFPHREKKCLYYRSPSTPQYMVYNCLGLISGFLIILSVIWLKWDMVPALKGKQRWAVMKGNQATWRMCTARASTLRWPGLGPTVLFWRLIFSRFCSQSCWHLSVPFSSCPFWDSLRRDPELQKLALLLSYRICSYHPNLFCTPVTDFACCVKNRRKKKQHFKTNF